MGKKEQELVDFVSEVLNVMPLGLGRDAGYLSVYSDTDGTVTLYVRNSYGVSTAGYTLTISKIKEID